MRKYFCDGCGKETGKAHGEDGLRSFCPPTEVLVMVNFKEENIPEPQREYLKNYIEEIEDPDEDLIDFDLCDSCYKTVMAAASEKLQQIIGEK